MRGLLLAVGLLFAAAGCGDHAEYTDDPDRKPGRDEVRDPVCGMIIDAKATRRAMHGGRTYSFCSDECEERFRNDPDRYVARR